MKSDTPRPYMLAESTWKTIKDIDYEVAVLPWGATEAHNYHLPYATDNIQCDYVAAESAKMAWNDGAKVIVLPLVPFGVNTGQLDIKLVINMNPSTQFAVLTDVVDTLTRQGIPKLVVLNGHGGNDFRQMIREIQMHYPDIFICVIDWYRIADWADYFDDVGDHGGEMETSAMLFIAPEFVLPLSEAGDGSERKFKIQALREGWAWAQRDWSKVSRDTGIGRPDLASAQKGQKYLDAVIEKIGNFLIELANCDKNDLYE